MPRKPRLFSMHETSRWIHCWADKRRLTTLWDHSKMATAVAERSPVIFAGALTIFAGALPP